MPRTTKARRSITSGEVSLSWLDRCDSSREPSQWFVYLLALQDFSAFKVGFTCKPLQRISTFNTRYFEYFDLRGSILLPICSNEAARDAEATLKSEFAAYRCAAPTWVAPEAGGHTEWFAAMHASEAERRLHSVAGDNESAVVDAYEYVRSLLSDASLEFERWAFDQARLIEADAESMRLGYAPTVARQPLRDWFDAYRYFGIDTFSDDPAVREFVTTMAIRAR